MRSSKDSMDSEHRTRFKTFIACNILIRPLGLKETMSIGLTTSWSIVLHPICDGTSRSSFPILRRGELKSGDLARHRSTIKLTVYFFLFLHFFPWYVLFMLRRKKGDVRGLRRHGPVLHSTWCVGGFLVFPSWGYVLFNHVKDLSEAVRKSWDVDSVMIRQKWRRIPGLNGGFLTCGLHVDANRASNILHTLASPPRTFFRVRLTQN